MKKITEKNKELEEHIEVLGEQMGVFGDEVRDLKKQTSELVISNTDLQRSVDYLRLEVDEAEGGNELASTEETPDSLAPEAKIDIVRTRT